MSCLSAAAILCSPPTCIARKHKIIVHITQISLCRPRGGGWLEERPGRGKPRLRAAGGGSGRGSNLLLIPALPLNAVRQFGVPTKMQASVPALSAQRVKTPSGRPQKHVAQGESGGGIAALVMPEIPKHGRTSSGPRIGQVTSGPQTRRAQTLTRLDRSVHTAMLALLARWQVLLAPSRRPCCAGLVSHLAPLFSF